jgi:toxin ParE1/3/4
MGHMTIVRYAPAALSDLEKITNDINANNGKLVAQKFLIKTKSSFEMLADYPFVGRKRSRIGRNFLSWPVPPYVVFYKPVDGGIEIFRVIYGRRRITKKLVEGVDQ